MKLCLCRGRRRTAHPGPAPDQHLGAALEDEDGDAVVRGHQPRRHAGPVAQAGQRGGRRGRRRRRRQGGRPEDRRRLRLRVRGNQDEIDII